MAIQDELFDDHCNTVIRLHDALSSRATDSRGYGRLDYPDHSVVKVSPCSDNTQCIRLIRTIDQTAIEDKNPDVSRRKRPLCGIEVGRGFTPIDGTHAKNGKLPDPNSGKTYSAELAVEGDSSKVRGYIGSPMFGRTEIWGRSLEQVAMCQH